MLYYLGFCDPSGCGWSTNSFIINISELKYDRIHVSNQCPRLYPGTHKSR
jgi:hypothetical protein